MRKEEEIELTNKDYKPMLFHHYVLIYLAWILVTAGLVGIVMVVCTILANGGN